jgi:hypothetical protein
MARPERFELPTPRSVVWCSIQLSYGRFGRRRASKNPGGGPYTTRTVMARMAAADQILPQCAISVAVTPLLGRGLLSRMPENTAAVSGCGFAMGRVNAIG